MSNLNILEAITRVDFYTFIKRAFEVIDASQEFQSNWHLELIADRLQQCAEGNIKRLIINIPPRNLKTFCASICLPAFILGHNPSARIINVGYSQDLVNSSSRKTRQLMESTFYKNLFETRLGNKNTESEFNTTKNGMLFATSVCGALTGFGRNFIIIDDPIKADDVYSETIRAKVNGWYNNTLVSRLNNKVKGCIILVMQRLHMEDLTGHLLKQDGWELLSLPAIAEKDEEFILSNNRKVGRRKGEALNPSLEPLTILENQKKIMTNYIFSAQYQQNPLPQKGNIIDFNDFGQFDNNIDLSKGVVYQSWDIALKDGKDNDYSVCITAKLLKNILYIIDIRRFKVDIYKLAEQIQDLQKLYNSSHLIIEESSVSMSLLQYISQYKCYPYKYRPKGDKISRANDASFHIKAGKVKVLSNTSWLDEFKTEINSFPNGKHDDQIDALSQLIDVALNKYNPFIECAKLIKEEQIKNSNQTALSFCKNAYKYYKLGHYPKYRF